MNRGKWLKLCISVFVIIALLAAFASGCGKSEDDSKATTSSAAEIKKETEASVTEKVDPYKEKVSLSMIHRHTHFGNQPFVEDDKVMEYIEKKFNVDIDLTFVPTTQSGGINEKLNMLIASGVIPDMIQLDRATTGLGLEIFQSLVNEKKLIDMRKFIPENSDRYPKLSLNAYDPETNAVYAEADGSLFMIPRYYGYWPHAWYIRADWLEKLGLNKPETLDEVKDVLRQFVKNDPDGKGNVGLTTGGIWWFGHFYAGFTGYQEWGVKEGELVSVWEMPEQKEGVKYMAELYKENLLDKDIFVSMSSGDDRAKFSTGKAGMLLIDAGFLTGIDKALADYNPAAKADFLRTDIQGPKSISRMGAGKFYEGIGISTGCKDPERALDILEWLLSDEGNDIWNNGVEGVHYTVKDGNKVYDEALMKHENWKQEGGYNYHRIMTLITLDMPKSPSEFRDYSIYKNFDTTLKTLGDKIGKSSLLGKPVAANTDFGGPVNQVIDKWHAEFITGEKNIDTDWDTMLKEMNAAGYDKIKKEANEKYDP